MRDKLNMSAYYFSVEPTGVREIDDILSAIAVAGDDDGSEAERIHAAANASAEKVRALHATIHNVARYLRLGDAPGRAGWVNDAGGMLDMLAERHPELVKR